MLRFRSKGLPAKKRAASTAPLSSQQSRLSPLDLPEILERVLSFLDERTLAFCARLVNSQWHTIAKALLPTTVELNACLDQKKRDTIVANLPGATRLILAASADYYHNNINLEVIRLGAMLEEKNRHCKKDGFTKAVPLKELILGKEFVWMWSFLRLLPSSETLTRLVLCVETYIHERLDLGTVLTAYPQLTDLELNNIGVGWYQIRDPDATLLPLDKAYPTKPIPALLKLRSIYFREIAVSQPVLQTLLASCPLLKELCLWRLETRYVEMVDWTQQEIPCATSFDILGFVNFLAGLSLDLRTFALSFKGIETQRVGRHPSSPAPPPSKGLEMVKEELEIVFAELGRRSIVQEWGFAASACPKLAHLPNRITTLELMSSATTFHHKIEEAHQLHSFLCNAPSLVHLRAVDIMFIIQDVDFHGTYPSSSMSKTSWACSGLETLHLTFCDPYYEASQDVGNRHVFGYLVRFCPLLKELEFGVKSQMTLAIESGLAILGRLQHLERVRFWPCSLGLKKSIERMWSLIQPGALDMIQRRHSLFKWRTILVTEERRLINDLNKVVPEDNETAQSSKQPEPWMDIKFIGTHWDIKMALDEMEKDPGLVKWWPRLQSIRAFTQKKSRVRFLERVIQSRESFQFSDRSREVLVRPAQWL